MIIDNITSHGANVTSSLAGNLSINEANGEIIIRKESNVVVRVDTTGFKYYDNAGTQRISVGQDTSGQQQIIVNDASGIPSILIGQDPDDGKPIVLVGKEGVDVVNGS